MPDTLRVFTSTGRTQVTSRKAKAKRSLSLLGGAALLGIPVIVAAIVWGGFMSLLIYAVFRVAMRL